MTVLFVHKRKYPLSTEKHFNKTWLAGSSPVCVYSYYINYKFTLQKLFHKKLQGRPQSVVTRSPLPPLLAGRPLSVPGFGDGDDDGGGDDGAGAGDGDDEDGDADDDDDDSDGDGGGAGHDDDHGHGGDGHYYARRGPQTVEPLPRRSFRAESCATRDTTPCSPGRTAVRLQSSATRATLHCAPRQALCPDTHRTLSTWSRNAQAFGDRRAGRRVETVATVGTVVQTRGRRGKTRKRR